MLQHTCCDFYVELYDTSSDIFVLVIGVCGEHVFFCIDSVKDVSNKEVLGILVSYRVKVKLVVSRGG